MLWKVFFYIKDSLQSFFSAALLTVDYFLFSFQQDSTKRLFRQSEYIHFETHCINLLRRTDKKKFIEDQFDNVNFNEVVAFVMKSIPVLLQCVDSSSAYSKKYY